MVHAHAGPRTATYDLFHPEQRHWTQPDPMRVAGITACILLNAVALMALMRPADLPLPAIAEPGMVMIDLAKPKPEPPPPPPDKPDTVIKPTQPVPVVFQHNPPTVPPADTTSPLQLTAATDVVDDSAHSVPPETVFGNTTQTSALDTSLQGPVSGVSLQYAEASAPPYPRELVSRGVEGKVLLSVHVGVDGRPVQVDIHRSSGNQRLDMAAKRHVLRSWRFVPATRNGVAVEAIGIVPIEFLLN